MIEPKNPAENPAVIMEFKVFNARKEKTLEDTVEAALNQIEEKQYDASRRFIFYGKNIIF